MKINLHIDRLILDGLPVERRQGPAIQEAIEMELTRLLAEYGASGATISSGSLHRLATGDVGMSPEIESDSLGSQIASSLFHGVTRQ